MIALLLLFINFAIDNGIYLTILSSYFYCYLFLPMLFFLFAQIISREFLIFVYSVLNVFIFFFHYLFFFNSSTYFKKQNNKTLSIIAVSSNLKKLEIKVLISKLFYWTPFMRIKFRINAK